MTARQDLTIRQGETWSFIYTKLSSGSAVNLTDYTARMSVKDTYNGISQVYLSTGSDANGGTITLGGALGTVTLSMTAAQSSAMAGWLNFPLAILDGVDFDITKPSIRYLYDLELISGAGVVTRELEGRLIVYREIST
jgi:hypothetical protein